MNHILSEIFFLICHFKNFGKRFSFQYFLYDSACPLRTNESKYLRENETLLVFAVDFQTRLLQSPHKAILLAHFGE